MRQLGQDTATVECWHGDPAQGLLGVWARTRSRAFAPIEEALLWRELMSTGQLSQHEIGSRCARDVSSVSRRLQVLSCLSDGLLAAVRQGKLSTWAAVRILAPLARANSAHAEGRLAASCIRRPLPPTSAPQAPGDAPAPACPAPVCLWFVPAFEHARGNGVRIQETLAAELGLSPGYGTLPCWSREADLRQPRKRSGEYVFAPGQELQHDTSPHQVTVRSLTGSLELSILPGYAQGGSEAALGRLRATSILMSRLNISIAKQRDDHG